LNPIHFESPWLIFLGYTQYQLYAKTGLGLVHWRAENCLAQLRYPDCVADLGIPDMTAKQASDAGARSLIIGVAPIGGALQPEWIETLIEAMEAGLDIVSGMHMRLHSIPELVEASRRTGQRLIDIREPPKNIAAGRGRKRTGKRILTVGTDCAVGKKFTALAIHKAMQAAEMKASFRASGQTGIMISGGGIPMDAVVSDFISGAAEILSPDNDPDHWDVIEGQGCLFHPAYASVTLGLLHGSQPDLIVLCHEAGRTTIDDYPDYPIPEFKECVRRYEEAARLTNPAARCIGISINTSNLNEQERQKLLSRHREETGLHCFDPIATGVSDLVEILNEN
jgi:uncharacterized NAD-dependent epimerase/dehydratase family protein